MECPFPRSIANPNGPGEITIPCGRCAVCLTNKAEEWKNRLRIQMEASSSAFFVTLTYDDEHLPHDENGNPCFSVRHLQLFHKLLRKRLKQGFLVESMTGKRLPLVDRKFKYFIVSEYGAKGEGHRPHYHGIYFDLPEDIWTTNLLICECWKNSTVLTVSKLTDTRINYTVEYAVDFKFHLFCPEGWQKPIMLRSIGLGVGIMTPDRLDWWRKSPHNRVYIPMHGKKFRLGRYLRDKIFDDDMKARIAETTKARLDERKQFEEPFEFLRKEDTYKEFEKSVTRSLYKRKMHI